MKTMHRYSCSTENISGIQASNLKYTSSYQLCCHNKINVILNSCFNQNKDDVNNLSCGTPLWLLNYPSPSLTMRLFEN
jgi:hypothetical protein